MQLESEERAAATAAQLLDERTTAELHEQFISVLGHDLRNPLSAIGSIAEVIVLKGHNTEFARLGNQLKASVKRMSWLIEDVMDFTRGRLGAGIAAHIEPHDDMTNALVAVVEEIAAAHPEVTILSRFEIAETVWCDRERVQQLLSNLVGNAVAHGDNHQPIDVSARVENDELHISVRNRGVPIDESKFARVFEPYWRPAGAPAGSGLGLGLFISKQIVASHGGTLTVTSSVSDGTRFVARFPNRAPITE